MHDRETLNEDLLEHGLHPFALHFFLVLWEVEVEFHRHVRETFLLPRCTTLPGLTSILLSVFARATRTLKIILNTHENFGWKCGLSLGQLRRELERLL